MGRLTRELPRGFLMSVERAVCTNKKWQLTVMGVKRAG